MVAITRSCPNGHVEFTYAGRHAMRDDETFVRETAIPDSDGDQSCPVCGAPLDEEVGRDDGDGFEPTQWDAAREPGVTSNVGDPVGDANDPAEAGSGTQPRIGEHAPALARPGDDRLAVGLMVVGLAAAALEPVIVGVVLGTAVAALLGLVLVSHVRAKRDLPNADTNPMEGRQ